MINQLLVLLSLLNFSAAASADAYHHEARVEGMACAFCAYRVSRRIESLDDVRPGSAAVDLESGLVRFVGDKLIDKQRLSEVFDDTGFTLEGLQVFGAEIGEIHPIALATVLVLRLDDEQATRFQVVLEAIGSIAAADGCTLRIRAPTDLELPLLRPLLAGRKHAIRVEFIASEGPHIELELLGAPMDVGDG